MNSKPPTINIGIVACTFSDNLSRNGCIFKGIIKPRGGDYSQEFLVGVCRPVLQILALFQTLKCYFPHPFSDQASKIHTRFQTWPLGRNYYLVRAQTKKYSNPFRIRIFLFLSYSFGIETINTFIRSRSSLENHTRFQSKMGKVHTRFQTAKWRKNPVGQHITI